VEIKRRTAENVLNAKLLFHKGRELAVSYARLSCIHLIGVQQEDLVRTKVSLN
jgi:hypothetical protein